MNKYLTLLIYFAFIGTVYSQKIQIAKPENLGMSSEKLNRIFDPIEEAIELEQIGNALGLVARDGKIVFLKAGGKHGDDIDMPTNAIVRLASIGKTVTAAAVMILYERGQIKLTDKVSKYLPEYEEVKVAVNNNKGEIEVEDLKRPMTIHHLLTHQSGIASRGSAFWDVWDKAKTTREFSSMIAKIPLESQPGAAFNYGQMGSSYELLAAIVEIISGKNFKDFTTDEILKPLKMNDTFFWVPESKRYLLSASYRINKEGKLVYNNKMGEESPPHNFWAGGGALRASIHDFYKFTQCLLNGGEYEGVRILKPETVQMMTSNQVAGGAFSHELGWGLGTAVLIKPSTNISGSVGAYGWNGGTGTRYMVDPIEKWIAIIFIPSRPRTPEVSRLRNQFIDDAYKAIKKSKLQH